MDGSKSLRSLKAEEFAEELKRRTGLPVIMQDERLTTVEADEIIRLTGIHKKNRKEHIDAMAASIILTDYLNQNRQGNGN